MEIEAAKSHLAKRSQLPIITFGGLKHTYNIAGSLLGYSGHFDEDVIERVRRHPDVSKCLGSLLSAYLLARDHADSTLRGRSHTLREIPKSIPWPAPPQKLKRTLRGAWPEYPTATA